MKNITKAFKYAKFPGRQACNMYLGHCKIGIWDKHKLACARGGAIFGTAQGGTSHPEISPSPGSIIAQPLIIMMQARNSVILNAFVGFCYCFIA